MKLPGNTAAMPGAEFQLEKEWLRIKTFSGSVLLYPLPYNTKSAKQQKGPSLAVLPGAPLT